MKRLSEMTRQEAFDAACAGLAKQGFSRSIGSDLFNSCQYRGHNGKKCALGHLIPDEDYYPAMENLVTNQVLDKLGVPYNHDLMPLLYSLQNAHDKAPTPGTMRESLRSVARTYDLVAPTYLKDTP